MPVASQEFRAEMMASEQSHAMSSRLPPLGRNRRLGDTQERGAEGQEQDGKLDPIEEQRRVLEYYQRKKTLGSARRSSANGGSDDGRGSTHNDRRTL